MGFECGRSGKGRFENGVRNLIAVSGFGVVNPVGFRERILADPVFAVALGNDLGQILAEHHTRILRIERQG